jgi:type VI protein secretion system component VasK
MKAYFLLAIGASWLAVAIFAAFNSFAIGFQPGALNPFASVIVLSALMLLFFLGWIAPASWGLWLLRKRRKQTSDHPK